MTEAERRHPAAAGGRPSDCFEYRLDRRMSERGPRPGPGRIPAGWPSWRPSSSFASGTSGPTSPSWSAWPTRLIVALGYLPVLALGLAGAAGSFRRSWPYVLCWLPAAYFTLLHVVFVSSIRYREPAVLALIVLSAGTATERILDFGFWILDSDSSLKSQDQSSNTKI
jgi:hypothetical protein